MSTLAQILGALAEHAELVELLLGAIEGGADKQSLEKALRAAMIQTSDAAMREELEKP